MREPKRITIFVGHYGSGKTELSINYALYLRSLGKKVVIVDFDIVNPYFRTKDAKEVLKEHQIKLIAPVYADTNLENPALPPEIYSVFDDKECFVVFDVGGGEDGTIPLGRYYPYFSREVCDVFFVLNARRLQTADLTGAKEAYRDIAAVSRIPITAIINNTHLKEETTPAMVLEGQELAREVSKEVGVSVAYMSGKPEILAELPKEYEAMKFPIHIFIKLMF